MHGGQFFDVDSGVETLEQPESSSCGLRLNADSANFSDCYKLRNVQYTQVYFREGAPLDNLLSEFSLPANLAFRETKLC